MRRHPAGVSCWPPARRQKSSATKTRAVAVTVCAENLPPSPGRDCICIHLKSDVEKFYLLCLMTRKLFAFAKQECMEENPDSITFQEVLTPGQLYLMFLKVTPGLPLGEHACTPLTPKEADSAYSSSSC